MYSDDQYFRGLESVLEKNEKVLSLTKCLIAVIDFVQRLDKGFIK